MVSIDHLQAVVHGHFKEPIIGPLKRWLRSAILKIDMTSFFSAEGGGGPILIKFRRLVQNDMSTAVIWSKSKPFLQPPEDSAIHS